MRFVGIGFYRTKLCVSAVHAVGRRLSVCRTHGMYQNGLIYHQTLSRHGSHVTLEPKRRYQIPKWTSSVGAINTSGEKKLRFLPRDAIVSAVLAVSRCPSVCPSVRPSVKLVIVPKWLKISSDFFLGLVAPPMWFLEAVRFYPIPRGNPLRGGVK